MATRATYTIDGMHFYCHWDGYPTGAASRMVKMIEAHTQPQTIAERASFDPVDDRRGGLAFAFIRGNLDAEPTKGRDFHGDTEWHYEVFTSKETGLIRCHTYAKNWADDPQRFKLQNDERLEDFCNRHGLEWKLPRVVSVKRMAWSPNWGGTADGMRATYQLATEDAARAIAALYRASAERHPEGSGNRAGAMVNVAAWEAALSLEPAA
jgi:hypothetical protein